MDFANLFALLNAQADLWWPMTWGCARSAIQVNVQFDFQL
jgi:hypothetical protein